MKPEQWLDEVSRQAKQRKVLNEKLAALVAMRDKYAAEQRAEGVVVRSRGRGYAEGANQAVIV